MEPYGGDVGRGHGDTLGEAVDTTANKVQESNDTLLDKTRQSLKKEARRLWKVERRIPSEQINFEKWSQRLGKYG